MREYQEAIEKDFGHVRFEIRTVTNSVGAINNQHIAYLTEDQALFVGSLSRNSERVVEFKSVLVRSFAEARRRAAVAAFALPMTYEDALQHYLIRSGKTGDFPRQKKRWKCCIRKMP